MLDVIVQLFDTNTDDCYCWCLLFGFPPCSTPLLILIRKYIYCHDVSIPSALDLIRLSCLVDKLDSS